MAPSRRGQAVEMKDALLSAGAFLLFAAAMTGCSTPHVPTPRAESYWDGDLMQGAPRVRINLAEQRAYFYKGEQLAGVSLISSGREGRETVSGDFRIVEKQKHHVSSLFGAYVASDGRVVQADVDTRKDKRPPGTRYVGAPMPHWMRIVGGIGMHEGFLPGYPASHGCIRLPKEMAAAFYDAVSVGTPVRIEP